MVLWNRLTIPSRVIDGPIPHEYIPAVFRISSACPQIWGTYKAYIGVQIIKINVSKMFDGINESSL